MAITMNIELPAFLEALYPSTTADVNKQKTITEQETSALVAKGWKFSFSMFMVTATSPVFLNSGALSAADNMPSLIPQLMAGKLSPTQLSVFQHSFESFVATVKAMDKTASEKQNGPGPTLDVNAEVKKKLINAILNGGTVTATPAVPAYMPGKPVVVPAPSDSVSAEPPKAKKVEHPASKASPTPYAGGVVKLADATKLGQLVYGTNKGSYYKVVAVGQVKVAARIVPAGVSIRVEGTFTGALVNRLSAMGFSKKSDYMSLHAATSTSLPASRVIGSVLMSMEVEFNEIIHGGAGLKY